MTTSKCKRSTGDSRSPTQRKELKLDTEPQVNQPSRLTSLPNELIEEVLSYVLPQGKIVNVAERLRRPESRRWKREADALMGQPSRRSRSQRNATAVLRVCQVLYECGIAILWRENIYLFPLLEDVSKWLTVTTEGPKLALRRLRLGRNEDQSDMAWPYDFSILASLPELRELSFQVPGLSSPADYTLQTIRRRSLTSWNVWRLFGSVHTLTGGSRRYARTGWSMLSLWRDFKKKLDGDEGDRKSKH